MRRKMIGDELRWALGFLRPHLPGVIGVFLLTFGQNYFYAMIPTVSTNFLFELLTPDKIEQIYRYFYIAIAIIFARAVFDFLKNYSMEVILSSVIKRIRDILFSHLMTLDIDFFKKHKTGNMISIGINDVEKINMDFYQGLVYFLSSVMIVVIVLIKLFFLNWLLTLLCFGVIPLIWLAIRVLGTIIRRQAKRHREALADLSVNLHEVLTGVDVVKSFAQEKTETSKFQENTTVYRKIYIKLLRTMNFFGPLNEVTLFVFAMGIIGIGAVFIVRGQWELKSLTEYLILLGIMTAPVANIPKYISNYKVASASVERVMSILKEKPSVLEAEKPVSKKLDGKIEFKNVCFAYIPNQDVLQGISFVAEKGEVVALVGPSGAGKSTIVNLIPRFYDVREGEVAIDDISVREYGLESLRSQIGIVSQNVTLFNTTIFDNIRYAKPAASEKEIVEAAKQAYAYDFIAEFEEGLETNVGEKGVRLSGGQKQRISIARTILMNPEILILDEATSSLDSESEHFIQLAVTELMKGRTTITIAHRLSTIAHATKILVIDKGKIVDAGSNDELLSRCALYKKIYQLQYFH
ncbi:MAG: ABC transporter ATP-binding protein [Spirochaetes bacterium]|nr:ABC transporter ATP-binding protein [Spirochaetota bacterium]